MTDAIEIRSDWLAPAATVENMVAAYNQMADFVRQVLKEGTDFGVIPGTLKPTLLKPGAEKLCRFFGLQPMFDEITAVEDWSGSAHDGEPFFYYRYRCNLLRGNVKMADAEGSANSWEKKYRYRQGERKCPTCGKGTIIKGKQEYGGGWLCWKKKGGCGAKFQDGDPFIEGQLIEPIKNPDIFDVVNTLQKMAQKRAFIATTLLAVNGSEYFTQDMEDLSFGNNVVEGEVVKETTPEKKPVAKKVKKPANGNRPYSPATVKDRIVTKASRSKQFDPTDKQYQLLRFALELCFPGDKEADDKRHTVLNYLTGDPSSKKVTGQYFKAIIEDWLEMKQDSGGEYTVNPISAQEAQAIFTEALKIEGQQEMEI